MTMTHDDWMREHQRLSGRLDEVRAKHDELARHAQYIPGPVLRKRQNVLDRLERDLLDELAALVDLDRDGAVS